MQFVQMLQIGQAAPQKDSLHKQSCKMTTKVELKAKALREDVVGTRTWETVDAR